MSRSLVRLIIGLVVAVASNLDFAQATDTKFDPAHLAFLATRLTKSLEKQDLRPNTCSAMDFASLAADVNETVTRAYLSDSPQALKRAEETAQALAILIKGCEGRKR